MLLGVCLVNVINALAAVDVADIALKLVGQLFDFVVAERCVGLLTVVVCCALIELNGNVAVIRVFLGEELGKLLVGDLLRTAGAVNSVKESGIVGGVNSCAVLKALVGNAVGLERLAHGHNLTVLRVGSDVPVGRGLLLIGGESRLVGRSALILERLLDSEELEAHLLRLVLHPLTGNSGVAVVVGDFEVEPLVVGRVIVVELLGERLTLLEREVKTVDVDADSQLLVRCFVGPFLVEAAA